MISKRWQLSKVWRESETDFTPVSYSGNTGFDSRSRPQLEVLMETAEIIEGLVQEIAHGDYVISDKEKLMDAVIILNEPGPIVPVV